MKKEFDVIVIGAGSGLTISAEAIRRNLKVAIIEKGPFGGTCLNRGCIPSKILIHTAEVVELINNSKKFNIQAKVNKIDWNAMMKRVFTPIDKDARMIEKGNKNSKNVTVYKKEAKFVGKKLLKVGNDLITAKKIFICAGTRPRIINLPGLNKVNYLTSKEALRLKKQPKKMIIIGGGFIAAELANFYSSIGTEVILVYRGNVLLRNEDQEISKKFTKIVSKKYKVMLNTNLLKVSQKGKTISLQVKQKGKNKTLSADSLLLAVGRISNADILDVKKTGVKLDNKNFIKVNSYLETNVKGIYAIGDIVGKYQLKHNANLEADYASYNAFNNKKIKISYNAMPHAIFSSPQIASVGLTEQELKKKGVHYHIGKYNYYDTGMGMAIEDREGFVKVLVDHNGKILGCHIMGTEASTLIHEVLVIMRNNLTADQILNTVHIHPALSEVVQRAFANIHH